MGITIPDGKKEEEVTVLYKKNSKGEYIPIEFKEICTSDWDNKLVVVKIGESGQKIPESEIEESWGALNDADALNRLHNTSFLITPHNLSFEVIDKKDLSKQCVLVKVKEEENISNFQHLQKTIKDQLKNFTNKTVTFPSALSLKEYNEIMEIKRRCEFRRRRGNI